MDTLRVKDWDEWFENAKSKTFKCKSQCSMPNKQGLGYRKLLRMPNGEAIFGAWCALIQALSRHQNRAGWVTENGKKTGKPWSARDLAELTFFSEGTCGAMIAACSSEDVGWLIVGSVEDTTGIPQGYNADTSVPCRAVDRIGLDWIRKEGEQSAQGDSGDGEKADGEKDVGQECPAAVTVRGSGPAADLVARCRVALVKIHDIGPEWTKVGLEPLVEMARAFPRLDVEQLAARVWQENKGQELKGNWSTQSRVRAVFQRADIEYEMSARKNAPPGQRRFSTDPLELLERRQHGEFGARRREVDHV